MKSIRTLTAACALLTAFAAGAQTPPAAAAGAKTAPMPAHAATMPGGSAADRMAMMDKHMQAMREMHDKMMNAKTPAEREALMAEHMKSMRGGMDMMQRMGCMGPMSGASGMGDGKGMPGGDMAQRQQAMEGCAQMMQMMMDMMGQRMPNAPASK